MTNRSSHTGVVARRPHASTPAGNSAATYPTVLNVMGCRSVQYGSFEDYLVEVTRSCRRRRLTPVFVYPNEPVDPKFRDEIELAGGRLLVIPDTETATFRGALRLWREMRQTRPAIVHAHFGKSGYLAAVLGKLTRTPVVFASKHQTSWPYPTRKTKVTYALLSRITTGILAGAQPVREELPTLGVPSSKAVMVPFPGVDAARYHPLPSCRETTRAALHVPPQDALVIAVAHLKPQKGVNFLIDAIPSVLDRFPSTSFVVVGDGAQREELEREVASRGVSGRVRFVGHRSDVPELVSASDVFVCPSLCEGACASVLEAMAAAKPIVSTPVGLGRNLIRENGTGVVVQGSDAEELAKGICQLLDQPQEWSSQGRRARESVMRRAEVHRVSEQLADVYVSALESAHSRSD